MLYHQKNTFMNGFQETTLDKPVFFIMQPHYMNSVDERCPFCNGAVYTTTLNEDTAECIYCKTQFLLEPQPQ